MLIINVAYYKNENDAGVVSTRPVVEEKRRSKN